MNSILDDLMALYKPENIIRAKDDDLPSMLSAVEFRLRTGERQEAHWATVAEPTAHDKARMVIDLGDLEQVRKMVGWAKDEIARREALFVGAYDNFQIGEEATIVAELTDWNRAAMSCPPQIGMSGKVVRMDIDLPTHVAIQFRTKELGYDSGRKFITLYIKRWAAEPVNGRKSA